MDRIDSHQHFWNYHPAKHEWMNDDMAELKKKYYPQDLEPLLKNCNLNGCVAVQANQAEEENEFLLKLANESTIIKGIVGWVDLQSEKIAEQLSCYKDFEKIKGFRHVIHDEPDIDFMLRPAFLRGINALQRYDYTYDILIFHHHLSNTVKMVQQFPKQPFVIDHIAKPDIKNRQFNDWKKQLAAVAAFPNVYCKISGMVTEANLKTWKSIDFRIYIDVVVELFGTERIMFGSDWPVCTLAAIYEDVYRITSDYFSSFTKDEQDKFFGLNAKRFYRL